MSFMNVNDIEIYYEVHGKGPSLLFIEGYTCNRLVWKDYIQPLSQSYQVILFDNRGSGQTSSPDMLYTVEMMAEDAAGLLKGLNIDSCFAVGHSFGGAIVQQLCIDYPSLIKKGIVMNSCAKAPEKWKRSIEWMNTLGQLDSKTYLEGVAPWIYSEEYCSDPIKLQASIVRTLANPYPQPLVGLKGQWHALSTLDQRPYLQKIQCPLLIASGDEDIIFPLFVAQELAENIPNAELMIFQGQAHMLRRERISEMIELIQNYLK